MHVSKPAAIGLACACLALVLALALRVTPAAAFYGCFCSKYNEDDKICGEILKYDRDSTIVIKPAGKARRTLEPIEFAECRAEAVLPPPLPPRGCPEGQALLDGACLALRTAKADERFGIAGSNTIGERLMPALLKAFGQQQGLVADAETCADTTIHLRRGDWTLSVACSAHGSHTGIPALAEGRADIAMLSRPISAGEQATMRQAGFPMMDTVRHETVVALDGLLVVVAPQNPVRALSIDQIARVFAGEIADWAQLGGAPGRIDLYVRDENSGTRDSFETMVMEPQRKAISAAAVKLESSSDLSDRVASDPRGIGFVGFAYRGRARALAVAQPCGITHEPSAVAIKTEDYPLARRLFLYTAKQHSIYSADLIHFALSDRAQPVIEGAGYVNLAIASWSAEETRARVAGYLDAPPREASLDADARLMAGLRADAAQAERLSIDFRFRPNSAKLDTKGLQDVIRLADYVRTAAQGRKLLLLGFADAAGSFATNLGLSLERAEEVRTSLLGSGAGLSPTQIVTRGYSELMPVACNADEAGRAKNRRVEAWLAPR
jgi:phosphate transport system substrate-binding protein